MLVAYGNLAHLPTFTVGYLVSCHVLFFFNAKQMAIVDAIESNVCTRFNHAWFDIVEPLCVRVTACVLGEKRRKI